MRTLDEKDELISVNIDLIMQEAHLEEILTGDNADEIIPCLIHCRHQFRINQNEIDSI